MQFPRFSRLQVGTRVIVSFIVVLAIMAAIIVTALWQLRSVHEMAAYLVNDKMKKQQLASDMLNAVSLNSAYALSIAKSDSLETMDYFEAERKESEADADELQRKLVAVQSDTVETALMEQIDTHAETYRAVLVKLWEFKERGQTLQVEAALESEFAPAFMQYRQSVQAVVDYHAAQAKVVEQDAQRVYEQGVILLLCLGALSIVAGAMLAWVLVRGIVLPLGDAIIFSKAVAEGNLTRQVDSDRNDEIGQLARALNHMSKSLARIVAQVRASTGAITHASGQIAAGNQDLSSRTEQQASALEQTAASMDELTSAVSRNAEHARQASLLAVSASEVAMRGGEAVAEVVHTMEEINEAALRVADIILVIDEIAFQTNILALNAAVEAARAGEQGRGFAVVATEVRSLAKRSAEAAREIKTLIGDSVQKAEAGCHRANRAGTTMNDIVSSVRQVTHIMNEIAGASQEQSERIEQVNHAVNQMEQGTQQNAALVEEAAAVSQAMRDQALQLQQMVKLFQLPSHLDNLVRADYASSPLLNDSEVDASLPPEVTRLQLAA